MNTNQTTPETATKHLVGKNSRRFTRVDNRIDINCNYAGSFRNIPILESNDGINFKIARGGNDTQTRFVEKIVAENDFSQRFPEIKIVD